MEVADTKLSDPMHRVTELITILVTTKRGSVVSISKTPKNLQSLSTISGNTHTIAQH